MHVLPDSQCICQKKAFPFFAFPQKKKKKKRNVFCCLSSNETSQLFPNVFSLFYRLLPSCSLFLLRTLKLCKRREKKWRKSEKFIARRWKSSLTDRPCRVSSVGIFLKNGKHIQNLAEWFPILTSLFCALVTKKIFF